MTISKESVIAGSIITACFIMMLIYGPKSAGNVQHNPKDTLTYHDYQLYVEEDSTWLFERERLVGIAKNGTCQLDSLIKEDNK